MTNANAEVYYESSTNSFSYKGSLSSGSTMNVGVSYYNSVWVLVTPSSSSAYVSVKASASNSSSSSDSSSLTSILVPVLLGSACCVGIIIFVIVCRIIRRRRMMQIYNGSQAAVMAHPSQQPQMNPNFNI